MASDFATVNRALSQKMVAEARKAGVYDHPSAKGDAREDLVRAYLAERVGTTFGVAKAEIVDSRGGTTPEIDAVIYDQSVAACLDVDHHRRIIRAETVGVTVEVRTELSKAAIDEKEPSVIKLRTLRRFFLPAAPLKLVLKMGKVAETVDMMRDGLPVGAAFQDVPAVMSALFAFEGPSIETAARYVQERAFDVICVLGKYTVAKELPGSQFPVSAGPAEWGTGDDALGSFFIVIEHALQAFRSSRYWVWPQTTAYFEGA